MVNQNQSTLQFKYFKLFNMQLLQKNHNTAQTVGCKSWGGSHNRDGVNIVKYIHGNFGGGRCKYVEDINEDILL